MCLFPRYFTAKPEDILTADLNLNDDVTSMELEWKPDSENKPTMVRKAIKGKPINSLSDLTRGLLKLPAWGVVHRPGYWTPTVVQQHAEYVTEILQLVDANWPVSKVAQYDEVFRFQLHKGLNPGITSFASFDVKLYQKFFLLSQQPGTTADLQLVVVAVSDRQESTIVGGCS